eukprot:gene17655-biopygen2570
MRDRFASKTVVSDFFKVFDPKRVPPIEDDRHHAHGVAELDQLLEHYGKPAEAILGRNSKGALVPAFYAKGEADRQKRSEAIVNPGECRREFSGFKRMQASQYAQGTFTDPSREKPKSPFKMSLAWYIPSAYTVILVRKHPPRISLEMIRDSFPSKQFGRAYHCCVVCSTLTGANLNWLMLAALEGPDLLPPDAVEEVIEERKARGMEVPV